VHDRPHGAGPSLPIPVQDYNLKPTRWPSDGCRLESATHSLRVSVEKRMPILAVSDRLVLRMFVRMSTTYLATKRSPDDGNMNQDYNKGSGAKAAEALYPGSKR
jgi:hypothetical protein